MLSTWHYCRRMPRKEFKSKHMQFTVRFTNKYINFSLHAPRSISPLIYRLTFSSNMNLSDIKASFTAIVCWKRKLYSRKDELSALLRKHISSRTVCFVRAQTFLFKKKSSSLHKVFSLSTPWIIYWISFDMGGKRWFEKSEEEVPNGCSHAAVHEVVEDCTNRHE